MVSVPPIDEDPAVGEDRLAGAEEVGFRIGHLRHASGLEVEDVLLAAGEKSPWKSRILPVVDSSAEWIATAGSGISGPHWPT